MTWSSMRGGASAVSTAYSQFGCGHHLTLGLSSTYVRSRSWRYLGGDGTKVSVYHYT